MNSDKHECRQKFLFLEFDCDGIEGLEYCNFLVWL